MHSTGPQLTYLVQVSDSVNERLAGHTGCKYTSPPHTHEQALQLVRLLLGGPQQLPNTGGPWHIAIAGGQRTVTLVLADRLFA